MTELAPLGFVMLCHTALDRAAQVARFWAEAGCPVMIHVDRTVPDAALEPLRAAMAEHPHLRLAPRRRCEWGTWSLIDATQTAAQRLLAEFPDLRHVCLISGSCLPLRPAAEMLAWLDARPDTDFIESVAVGDVTWTAGGLSDERFTLWFPFAWKRRRWLFDRFVDLQRALGIAREIPRPVRPHLGTQWWCLTATTLRAILTDPKRRRYERYFRQVWIPDESYFQTLARLHARRLESRPLTLVKFDRNGRPHVFYDDHLELLRRSDCFLARKVWPRAGKLYAYFLSDQPARGTPVEPQPERIHRHFDRANLQRATGRAGLYMQSRFPANDAARAVTAAPYSVFSGFAEVFDGFERWLSDTAALRVHGRLFHPDRVRFAGDAQVWTGALSDSAALRDYNPRMFLSNLIWSTRGERQGFQYGPGCAQHPDLNHMLARDPNAQISVITGAWALPLFRGDYTTDDLRGHLAWLQKREAAFLDLLRSEQTRARVRIWTLAEFLEDPDAHLAAILAEIAPALAATPPAAPPLRPLGGFGAFLARMRDDGLPLVLLGDYPISERRPAP